MADFYSNSIFWIDVGKVRPNPYQPRREFDEHKLNDLAESIRQYGVLQPLVVTRHEVEREDGGLVAEYELIAGERRLRASKIAGLAQVPALIRASAEDQDQAKLELAIIENLQREDLNPIDRAQAFRRLIDEFDFSHTEIGRRVGKSRVYVSNTLRLLGLSEEMQQAVAQGKITEGHTRPLLMLSDKPEEQYTLFREIVLHGLNVREAEQAARSIATEKVRKASLVDPEMRDIERKLSDTLGTRVQIEGNREKGGRLVIKYFSGDDLTSLLSRIEQFRNGEPRMTEQDSGVSTPEERGGGGENAPSPSTDTGVQERENGALEESAEPAPSDAPDDDVYSVRNFSI